jgi:hypothetical protein
MARKRRDEGICMHLREEESARFEIHQMKTETYGIYTFGTAA